MAGEFEGKVALVAGGGSGVGRACAIAFAREGADVVVADIDTDGGDETVHEIGEQGGEAIFIRTDVRKPDQVEAMVQGAIASYGRLDYACNNAVMGGPAEDTADYRIEDWDLVLDVNLRGAFLCMKYEIPQILATGGGAIVNVASILGLVGWASAPAYVAAKHGLIGLTKAAALEYATKNLRINAVCPGFIDTPLLFDSGVGPETEIYNTIRKIHPMKRMGQPGEVAELVVWLCSDKASLVTASPILIDGGYVAQ